MKNYYNRFSQAVSLRAQFVLILLFTFLINVKASPSAVLSFTPYSGVYDGSAHTVEVTVSGGTGTNYVVEFYRSANGGIDDKRGGGTSSTETIGQINAGTYYAMYRNLDNPADTSNPREVVITISQRQLTITAPTIATREYDGTKNPATATPGTLGNLVSGEDLTVTPIVSNYSSEHASTYTNVDVSYSISDGLSGYAINYIAPISITNGNAVIAKRVLSYPSLTISPKPYDGNTTLSATYITRGTLDGMVSGESFGTITLTPAPTLSTKNVGTQSLTLTYVPSGPAAGTVSSDYTFPSINLTGSYITARALSITTPTVTRPYNGSNTPGGNVTKGTISNYATGESNITCTATASDYSDKDAAANYTVDVSYVLTTNGTALATNYTLANSTNVTAAITKLDLTITGSTVNPKQYDGTNSPGPLVLGTVTGYYGDEQLTVTGTASNYSGNGCGGSCVGTSYFTTITYSLADKANGGLAINYNLPVTSTDHTADIIPRVLTIALPSIASKEYDATTTPGTLSINAGSLGNLVGSQFLNTTTAVAGNYSSANVGSYYVPVTYTLHNGTGGVAGNRGAASNYSLPSVTATGTVTPRVLTCATTTIASKIYDGTTTAGTVTVGGLSTLSVGNPATSLPGNETLTVSGSANNYTSKNVGNYTNTTVHYTLGNGTGLASNYSIADVLKTGAITRRDVAVVSTVSNDKVYDRLTAATVSLSDNKVSGDDLSYSYTAYYSDKTVANSKTVYVTAISISGGADIGNYSLTTPTISTTGNITRKDLSVTATGIDKIYDRLTTASVNLNNDAISGDVVTNSYSAADFDTKNIGTGKIVTVTGIAISGGGDAGNYSLTTPTVTTTANITQKVLIVTASSSGKIYDALTGATVTLSQDEITGDVVVPTYSTASFANKTVATGKIINVTGIGVTGADAGNYSYNTTATASSDITAKSITVTATGINKIYDQFNTATVTLSNNKVSGDDVTNAYTAANFDDKNVGDGKNVSVTGISIGGADKDNYTLSSTSASTSANITKKGLIVSASSDGKVYDALTIATVSLNTNKISGDVVVPTYSTASFATKTVATDKTISVSGIGITGDDAGNYSNNTTASTTANISLKTLNVNVASADDKVYDGDNTATIHFTVDTVSGDNVMVKYTGTFDDKNVGTSKTVTASNVSIIGIDASNYLLNVGTTTTTAKITAKSLTVTASGSNKIYDGSIPATVSLGLTGKVSGDVVLPTYTTANFNDKTVANGKLVFVSGISVSGTDKDNYSINTTATTTANVTLKSLTVTATGIDKVYDGLTVASVSLGLVGKVTDDLVTPSFSTASFNTKNVGIEKVVSVSGITISGDDYLNYSINTTASTTANITQHTLTIGAPSIAPKDYDGSAKAGAVTCGSLSGVQNGETVTVTGSADDYDSKNVGTYNNVPVNYTLSDATNYSLAAGSATGVINKLALTITGTTVTKSYDGTPSAGTVTVGTIGNYVGTETLSITGTAGVYDGNVAKSTYSNITVNYSLANGTNGGLATNYSLATSNDATGSITPKVLTIGIPTIATKEYDGFTTSGVVTVGTLTGFVNPETVTETHTVAAYGPNAGNHDVLVTYTLHDGVSGGLATNYSLVAQTVEGVTISKKALTITGAITSRPYNGTKTAGAVTFNMPTLVGSEDLVITGSAADYNQPNASTYPGTVITYTVSNGETGLASNYSVPTSLAIGTITPAVLSYSTITITSRAYDGTKTPVQINYGSVTGYISPESFATITRTAADYSGSDVGTYSSNISFSFSTPINNAAPSNYVFPSVTVSGAITPKALTIGTPSIASRVYDGTNTVGTLTIGELTGFVEGESLSVTGTAANYSATNANTYSGVEVDYSLHNGSGKASNYSLASGTATGIINPRPITITANAGQTKVYGTSDPVFTYTSSESLIAGNSFSGLLTRNSGENVNDYTINQGALTAGSNYAINFVSDNFAITKAALTAKADNKSKIYGSVNPSLTMSYSGYVAEDNISAITSLPTVSTNAVDASVFGTYTITVSGGSAANYTITPVNGVLDITKATVTATADNKTKVYGDANPSLTVSYTGFALDENSSVLDALPTITTTATNLSPVTSYPISISGGSDNNYVINTVNGILAVTQATVTATADNKSKVYGEVNPSLTISYSGFVNGDTKSNITEPTVSTTALPTSSVGNYPISVSGGSATNYIVALVNGTLSVDKATLTATADGKSKVYGTANPSLTISYSGFVNGDSKSNITQPTVSTNALPSSSVGSYTISVTGGSATNYTLSRVDGSLEITKATVTVTADNKSKIYGTANPSLTVTYGTFALSDNESVIDVKPIATTAVVAATAIGTYDINVSGGLDNNYDFTYVKGNLVVGNSIITVTVDPTLTKVYGDSDPQLTYTYTPSLSGTDSFSGSLVRASGESVGNTYAISQGSLTAGSNYTIIFNSSNFAITQRPLTVTAVEDTKIYDGGVSASATPSITSGTLASGDSPSFTETYSTKNAGTGLTLTPSGSVTSSIEGNNYLISFVPQALGTITKRTFSISGTKVSKEYDGGIAPGTVNTSNLVFTNILESDKPVIVGSASEYSGIGKNAGALYTVTVTYAPLQNNNTFLAGNYNNIDPQVISGIGNADIIKKKLNLFTITGQNPTINDKVYDGTTTAGIVKTPGAITAGVFATIATGVTTPSERIFVIGSAADYTSSNVGTYVGENNITYTLSNGYNGGLGDNYQIDNGSATGVITPKALTLTSPVAVSKIYDGLYTATITGTLSGVVTKDLANVLPSLSGTFASKDVANTISVDAALCTITGSASTNYTLTKPTGLTANITPKEVTISDAAAVSKVYDRLTSATITGSLAGVLPVDNGNVTLNLAGSFGTRTIGIGKTVTSTSNITGSASGNYSLTQPTGLTADITTKTLTLASVSAQSKVYDGLNTATVSATLIGVIPTDDVTLSLVGTFADKNVANPISVNVVPSISGADIANYTVQSTVTTSSITKKLVTVDGSIASKYYDGTKKAGEITYAGDLQGLVGSETLVLSGSAHDYNQSNASEYHDLTIEYSLADGTNGGVANNYYVNNTPGMMGIILPEELYYPTVTISDKVYDGSNTHGALVTSGALKCKHTPNNVLINGETFTATPLTITNYSDSKVGSYTSNITYTLSAPINNASYSNYVMPSITVSGNIIRKPLTISNPIIASKVYDGSNTVGALTIGTISSGLVPSETLTVTGTASDYSSSNVGSYSSTVNYTLGDASGSAGNYSLVASVVPSCTITPQPITVTATSTLTKVYGTVDPELTYTSVPTLLAGNSFTSTLKRIANENVGSYAIIQNGLSAGPNYSINSFVGASLTITPVTLTAAVTPTVTKVYGAVIPTFAVNYIGFVNGEDESVISVHAIATTTATQASSIGTYPIIVSGGSASNYVFAHSNGTLNITKAPLTAIADDKFKIYGSVNPSLTISYNGFVNGDTKANITEPAISTTAIQASAVGTYAITVSGGSATNYDLSYNNGILSVSTATITVTVDAGQSKIYGKNDPSLTYTSNPSNVTFTGSLSRTSGENVGSSYTITQGSLSAGSNNTIIFVPNTFEITKSTLTVTAVPNTKVYDGTVSAVAIPTISGTVKSGDTPNFTELYASKDANNGITINAIGSVSDGNGGNNYQITMISALGTITPRPFTLSTITVVKVTREYNATNSKGDLSISSLAFDNIANGDGSPSIAGTASVYSGTGNSKNANSFYTVTVTYTVSDNGPTFKSSNYLPLANQVLSGSDATITPKILALAAPTINTKVYDGTTTPASITAGSVATITTGVTTETIVTHATVSDYSSSNAGTYNNVIVSYTLSEGTNGGIADNYILAPITNCTATVSPKALTLSSVSVNSKVYDGLKTATVNGTLTGVVAKDNGNVAANLVGEFNSASVGTSIPVVASSSTLTGSAKDNYTLTIPTGLSANITSKTLTIASISVDNKEYDRTTTATLHGTLSGVINSDDVNLVLAANFADKIVGTSIAVTSLSTITGSGIANYTLTQPVGLTANITAKELTVSSVSVNSKVYDGLTNATINGALTGVISGDVVTLVPSATFSDKNVGSRSVTSTSTLSGADKSNYVLTQPTGLSANISVKALTITGSTIASRVYDGTTTAGTVIPGTLVGLASGESLTVTGTAADYVNDNASEYTLVPVIYTLGNGSGLASNYSLASGTCSGFITPRPLTFPSITIADKIYDGTTAIGTYSLGSVSGLIPSETFDITVSATPTYTSKNVGTQLATFSFSLSNPSNNAAYANYSLVPVVVNGNILPKPLSIGSPSIASKVYDGTKTAGNVTAGSLSGFIGTERVTVSSAVASNYSSADVNTYSNVPVTYTLANGTNGGLVSNYSLSNGTATGVITAKPLTVVGTTVTKVYNGTNSAGVATVGTINGLVSAGDVTVSINTVANYSGAAVNDYLVPVTYTINSGTVNKSNYSLAGNNAFGSITKAILTITPNDRSKYFGDTVVFVGTEFTTTVSDATIASVTLTSAGAYRNAKVGTDENIYSSNAIGTGLDNYTIIYNSGVLKVLNVQATLTSGVATTLSSWDPMSDQLIVENGELIIDIPVNLANITVKAGGKLTLAPGIAMTISGDFNIESNATNTGTFVDQGGVLTVDGKINVNQFLKGGRNWYIASPLVSAPGYASDNISVLRRYNEPTGTTDNLTNSSTLSPFEGLVATTINDGYINFTGNNVNTFTTGDQTISSLTRTASSPSPGFNLIGNPYPSYIDWDLVERTNVQPTIWYRTKNSSNSNVFDTYNSLLGLGTNLNGQEVTSLIPPMQTVWCRVNTVGTGSLTFPNDARSHSDGTSSYLNLKSGKVSDVIKLKVTDGKNSDETIIAFNQNASNGFDNYDSQKMFAESSSVPQLYTNADGEKLVINGLQNVESNTTIPVGFKTTTVGSYTISANEILGLNGVQVILKDAVTGNSQVLNEKPNYTFVSDETDNANRFSVTLKAGTTLGSLLENTISVYTNENFVVVNTTIAVTGTVEVVDMLGRSISSQPLTGLLTQIDKPSVSGTYVVKVKTNESLESYQIIIK